MAIAQRRLPWRLPTKWAWAMARAGRSREGLAELWRDSARVLVALSLVLRLALWRDPARFLMALSLVLRLALWRDPARFLMALSLVLRLALEPQVPSSPSPKRRLSLRSVPARQLRPCYRLPRVRPPPGAR